MPADPSAAYAEFAAAANDGYAQFNMGLMHLKGWGVRRDPMKALPLFKASLERGVGAAANGIGVLAYNSAQGRADYTAALRWFERGANMSDADSTFNVGTLYLHGEAACGCEPAGGEDRGHLRERGMSGRCARAVPPVWLRVAAPPISTPAVY
jgi:TPR repeat protein